MNASEKKMKTIGNSIRINRTRVLFRGEVGTNMFADQKRHVPPLSVFPRPVAEFFFWYVVFLVYYRYLFYPFYFYYSAMYFIVRSIDECVSCVHLRIVSRISDVSMQIR